MKKVPILLLFLLSIPMYAQDITDSLLYLLEPLEGEDRIGILRELCWENRFSHPEEALKYGLEALSLVKEFESSGYEAGINNYLGIVQRNVGNHAMALEYFFNARRIANAQKNLEDLAYAYNNIGDIQKIGRAHV